MTKTEGENGKFALKWVFQRKRREQMRQELQSQWKQAERRPASTSKKVPLSKKAKEGELC